MLVALAACTSDPEASPTEIPTRPASSGDLLCGMSRTDVATATGVDVGSADGDLATPAADGERTCEVRPTDGSDAVVFVWVDPASSARGKDLRAQLDGDAVGVAKPDVRFDSVDAAGWRGGPQGATPAILGGTVVLADGDQVVKVTTTRNGSGRDPLEDALALAQQVGASQDASAQGQ
ncbi:MAG: hypothetical protein AAGC49_01740 [Brevundimonas sp.]